MPVIVIFETFIRSPLLTHGLQIANIEPTAQAIQRPFPEKENHRQRSCFNAYLEARKAHISTEHLQRQCSHLAKIPKLRDSRLEYQRSREQGILLDETPKTRVACLQD